MRHLFSLILLLIALDSSAQSFSTTAAELNSQRIHTDIRGMTALAGWGALNTVGGLAGYFSSDKEESRHFYQMNVAWGVINLSIAGLGYFGARRELHKQYDGGRAFNRYEATRRLYLLNAGLDGLYMATGLYLTARAKNDAANPELLRGYGNALILQGAGLLLFDVTMYASHSTRSKRWYKALQSVCLTGNGVGLQYKL